MRKKIYINFLGIRKYTMIFSILVVIFSLYSLFSLGLNFGLDFTGGIIVHVNFDENMVWVFSRKSPIRVGF